MIPETVGTRKIRIPLKGHGKPGGGRVIYEDVVVRERICFYDLFEECTNRFDDETEAIVSASCPVNQGGMICGGYLFQ